MRKSAMVFFSLLLVVGSCCISGCSSNPVTGNNLPSKTSPSAVTSTPKKLDAGGPERYGFEDTFADLMQASLQTPESETTTNFSSEKHVKQVRGADFNENGDAASWTYILDQGGLLSVVSYTQQGLVVSRSEGTYEQPDILFGRFLVPRDLLQMNRDLVFAHTPAGTAVIRDISLRGGYYTITVRGTPRILIFNATSGALISSND